MKGGQPRQKDGRKHREKEHAGEAETLRLPGPNSYQFARGVRPALQSLRRVEREGVHALKVTLLVPTLNEIEGVRAIMPRIGRDWCDQILVIDGGSIDGTIEYLRGQGFQVLTQRRAGMRYAYLEALPYVTGDVVVTFSPDGNSIPELIPSLIGKMREGYDMVIASRYAYGARSEDDDAVSRLANRVFTFTINLLFRAQYTDAMGIFRAYRRALIHELDLDSDRSYWPEERLLGRSVSWEPLLSIRAAKRRLRVADVPGDEPERIGGRRPLHVVWGLAYILEIGRELLFWR
jgi:glycosyltransferase involved in cell wall biosynthesis